MPTMEDIAKKVGVTKGTVSKAINGAPDISESLRKTILETAVEMGYSRISNIKSEKRFCILVSHMEYEKKNDFGYEIIMGFKKAAQQHNSLIHVEYVSVEYQNSIKYDAFLLKNKFLGAFLLGFSQKDPWLEELKTTKAPTVLLDMHIPGNDSISTVGIDSLEGMEKIIEYLISQGHKK